MPFINTVRRKSVKGAQACLKSSMIAFLCRSDLAMENVVTKLENLNAGSVTRSFGGRGKVAPLNCQGEGGCGRHSIEPSQRVKAAMKIV